MKHVIYIFTCLMIWSTPNEKNKPVCLSLGDDYPGKWDAHYKKLRTPTLIQRTVSPFWHFVFSMAQQNTTVGWRFPMAAFIAQIDS